MVDVMLEIIEQFVGCRIALAKVACQSALKDFVEAIVDALIEGAEIRDRHAHHVVARFFGGVPFEKHFFRGRDERARRRRRTGPSVCR